MNEALAWVGQIVEWVGRFVPRWIIVRATHGGVKYRGGKTPVLVTPGICWWWPVRDEVDLYPTVRQTDNLPSQTFMLADNKVLTVGGMVIYEVADILRLLTETHSAIHTIRDISLAAIHGVCAEMTLDELHREQRRGTLDTKLKNAAKRQLEDYGVRVLKVQLTDLAPSRVLRLVQSTTKDDDN